jgi:hypothetical protein
MNIFNTANSSQGTGFKFGANHVTLEVTFESSSKDGSTPKQIQVKIPDTYNRKTIWIPKQESKEKAMPFNKFKFSDGTEMLKGQMMTGAQANEFEATNFVREISNLATAFGIEEPIQGENLTDFINNFISAANGRKAWVKMVYKDAPSGSSNKYYLEISKEKKGWISQVEGEVIPTLQEIEHKAKAEAFNKQEPGADMTSNPTPSDGLPF